jgi:hypothetical protein
MTIKGEQQ